jgi:glycosyltransferase involved in cell wall biosynthesis
MKRLGFLCPPLKRDTSHTNGAIVAEKSLVCALIQYSSLDKIDYVAVNTSDASLSEELRALFEKNKDRVRCIDYDAFALGLSSTGYHAFFQSGPDLNTLAAFRDALAHTCFPVTTLLHSVANAAFWDPFSPLYTYPFQPCDAFFCSTKPLMHAVQNARNQAEQQLSDAYPSIRLSQPMLAHASLGVGDLGPVTTQERLEARAQWGIAEDAFCFLCLGRLDVVAKMDLLPLLSAFRDCKVLSSFKRAKLVIAGSSRDASHWKAFLAEQVHALDLEGRVDVVINFEDEKRRSLYALSDAFVSISDSIQESFGVAPVEAMLCGLPVILSDWDGYKELVEHEKTGLLIPTYWADCNPLSRVIHEHGMLHGMLSVAQSVAVDVGALRDALIRVAEDVRLRERLGAAARVSALERFSWKRVVARYEEIWAELNAIAQARPWPLLNARSPRMSFFESFKHYATTLVNEHSRFKTTIRGQRTGSGAEALSLYPGLKAWIDPKLVGALITLCLNGDTVDGLAQKVHLPLERVLYTLLWMLKHDLIKPFDS